MRNFSEMESNQPPQSEAQSKLPNRCVLAGCVIDLPNERFWRDGAEMHLRPKTWQLLLHLAQRPFQLVTRDELFQALWPTVVVCNDSLVQCVSELRHALADHQHRIVKTVSRRGYRFDAKVSTNPAGDGDDCKRAVLDGFMRLRQLGGRDDIAEARRRFELAHQLDDTQPDALSGLALSHVIDVLHRWSRSPRWQIEMAREAADAALALEDRNALAHHAKAHVAMLESCYFEARVGFEKALSLDPLLVHARLRIGLIELEMGHAERTGAHASLAGRLSDPSPSLQAQIAFVSGMAAFHLEDDQRAEMLFRHSLRLNPCSGFAHQWLAAIGALRGDAGADEHVASFQSLMPGHTIESLEATERSRHPVFRAQRKRLYEGLRQAGVPP